MGLSKRVVVQGVAVHNDLTGRDVADAHPQSAISGLATAITNVTNTANGAASDADAAVSAAADALTTAAQADGKADQANTNIGDLSTLPTTAKGSLVEAVSETFTNANDLKTKVVAGIVGKGGAADTGMTGDQLKQAITDIPNVTNSTGDATEPDVRSGRGFSNAAGINKIGSLDLSKLIPENIREGITIDGKLGTLAPGKKFAVGSKTGVTTTLNPYTLTINPSFVPTQVFVIWNRTGGSPGDHAINKSTLAKGDLLTLDYNSSNYYSNPQNHEMVSQIASFNQTQIVLKAWYNYGGSSIAFYDGVYDFTWLALG